MYAQYCIGYLFFSFLSLSFVTQEPIEYLRLYASLANIPVRQPRMLYKEDFAKVMEGITEMVNFVKEHKPEYFENNNHEE